MFFPESTLTTKQTHVSNIPFCGSCGLHKHCTTPKIKVYGQGAKKILIVAETPSKEDDLKGKPFLDKAGMLFRSILKQNNVDLFKDCWSTYAVLCRPRKNETPTVEQISACSANLFNAIKKYNPRVIILQGGVPIQALIGTLFNTKLPLRTAYIGWTIPYQDLNLWICPTYLTSYAFHTNSGAVGLLIKKQIKEAVAKAKTRPWKVIPDYKKDVEVITNTRKASLVLKDFLTQGGPISFDYETNCLKPEYKGSEIYSCSVCYQGERTIAFPWSGDVIETMIDIFKSPMKKSAHNLKFEDRWTRYKLKTRIKNWYWDSMIAAHVLDNRPKITGLKFQAFVLLGQKSYNENIQPFFESTQKGTHLNRIHEISMEDLLLYNGLDSLVEEKVAQKQMRLLGETQSRKE